MLVGGTKRLIMLRRLALPSPRELFEDGERFVEKEAITRQQILKAVRETRRRR